MLPFEYPYMAVLVSSVLAFILGLLWYHPKIMGGRWREARGIASDSNVKPTSASAIFSFLLWFIAACFYGFLVTLLEVDDLPSLISLACLLWVAFAMPPVLMGTLLTGYPFQAAAIDSAYQLGGYYVFSLVFSVLG
jgi:hypothetical protein